MCQPKRVKSHNISTQFSTFFLYFLLNHLLFEFFLPTHSRTFAYFLFHSSSYVILFVFCPSYNWCPFAMNTMGCSESVRALLRKLCEPFVSSEWWVCRFSTFFPYFHSKVTVLLIPPERNIPVITAASYIWHSQQDTQATDCYTFYHIRNAKQ